MDDQEHFAHLEKGVDYWNRWRSKHPEVLPVLRELNLRRAILIRANLVDADLTGTDLSEADLSSADLSEAGLHLVDFSNANLSRANLTNAELQDSNLTGTDLIEADLSDTNLRKVSSIVGADLTGACLIDADLIGLNLRGVDLTEADLTQANLKGVNFKEANLTRAKLQNAVNLKEANLSGANLYEVDLHGVDLSGASLIRTNLSRARLIEVNLSGANLTEAQALTADFTGSTFTGACLQDWNINDETKLYNVKCDYIYLKGKWSEHDYRFIFYERCPTNGNFSPKGFSTLLRKVLQVVNLVFTDGIDWKAFFASFQNLQSKYGENSLSIQAIEKKGAEAFVIRLEVSPEIDKPILEEQFNKIYTKAIKILESQYRKDLKAKDTEIAIYRNQSADLMEIVKLQATKPINVEAKAVATSQSDSNTFSNDLREAKIGNFANEVKDNARQQAHQYNYASPEKQTLAEAADEIQRLLRQLEETNPTATESEQISYINVAAKPDLKHRAIAALKAGGDTAIDEFFLENKYLKVGKAVIKGWLQPSG